MSRRNSGSLKPDIPADSPFEIITYETRAIRALHDAMLQQLASGQAKPASETAVLLLDRLKACWLNESLSDFFENFIDWETGKPDLEALNHLRYIDRTRDEEFGALVPRTGADT